MNALDGFLGKGFVEVSIKGKKLKILVDFGEIRIPKDYVKEKDIRSVEEEFDCIIRKRGNYVIIRPSYFAEKGFICSCDDEDISKLEQWFNKNSKGVVARLLAD